MAAILSVMPAEPGDENKRAKAALSTRMSLIEGLTDWQDQRRWQEFYDTYWRLIFSVARKSGLSEDEAHEVVQETILTVAKNVSKYDPEAGPFKNWLLNTTRWRINDQFRKRDPAAASQRGRSGEDTGHDTDTVERLPGQDGLDAVWDEEWKRHLFETALTRVKNKVSARQFQIFDCLMVKRWAASKVSTELRVSIAQVYLAKHRLGSLMKKEVEALEKQG